MTVLDDSAQHTTHLLKVCILAATQCASTGPDVRQNLHLAEPLELTVLDDSAQHTIPKMKVKKNKEERII